MIGLVIGGVASGVGKTTLTLGLIGALRRRGLVVQPFKVGPDYIDPSQHSQVAGRPSRNLDSWLLPEDALRELFARAAATADAAIVEGVMGLFDGRSGAGEVGSTAHVARLLGLPVLLVVDAAKAARSVAATVVGCQQLARGVAIVGAVLNNVAGDRHAAVAREAIESLAGLPVLGWLPRTDQLRQEERYLGLVPAAERRLPTALVETVAGLVERELDLDRLLGLATVARPAVAPSGLFPPEPLATRTRIALARDEAFSFHYQDSLDLLTAWGAELVPFSPLHDRQLPAGIGGVILGGGFPELFGETLAANAPMLAAIRLAHADGLTIYAECGGLMYLQRALTDVHGRRHTLAGVLPGESTLVGRRLTIGYREVRARRDSPLALAGTVLRGHEHHRSTSNPPTPGQAAYDLLDGSGRLEGYVAGNVLASYLHVHLGSGARLAPRFVASCARAGTGRLGDRAGAVLRASTLPRPPSHGVPNHCAATTSAAPTTPESPVARAAPAEPAPIFTTSGDGGEIPRREGVRATAGAGAPGPLLRRFGLPPEEIEALSRERIERQVGGRLPPDEPERGLVARLVYAAGDPSLADLVEMVGDPVARAVAALRRRAPLVVDVRMAAAGLSRPLLAELGVELHVAIAAKESAEVAARVGVTRSAAGILALADLLDGAVVAVGNAPTALLAVLDLSAERDIRPAVVIGMPVGFVAAAESKGLLIDSGLPCIALRGTRGGSPMAAATVNALLRLAADGPPHAAGADAALPTAREGGPL